MWNLFVSYRRKTPASSERVQEARGVQSVQARSEERDEALYQSMLSGAFAGEL
jgi:hypothetical protein